MRAANFLRIWRERCGFAFLALGLIFAAGMATQAEAQVESGTIAGVVRDSSGAVIPRAHVTVTRVTTQRVRSTETDGSGEYSVPFLTAGSYNLQVSKRGFQTVVEGDLTLEVAQTLRTDVTLKPGSIQQKVEVTAKTPVLQTSNATLGQTLGGRAVENLPLNGRNFLDLASLSAGTATHEPGARDSGEGGFSSGGGRVYDNNIMLDGVDDNNLNPDLRSGTDFIVKPIPDAIAEMKVETNGYGPEFGRGGGAAVNVAMKSGSNEFHGDVWEFLRNNKLDARNFFDFSGHGAPPFKRNQFGFTAGGPIVRNHTFFFGDYEGTRIRQSESLVSVVPTAQEKVGNFSDGLLGQISDPNTGLPYPNQQIPASQLDPVAVKVAQFFPDPNLPGTNLFAFNPVQQIDANQFDIRVDHQLNQSTPIFGRISYSKATGINPGRLPGLAVGGRGVSGPGAGTNTTNATAGVAIGITHIFSPSIVNDFRFGYGRLNYREVAPFSDVNEAAALGIPGIPFVPGITGGLPNFGFSDVQHLGSGGCTPTFEIDNVFTYRDVLKAVRGNHSMSMGFEARPTEFTIFQPCGTRGEFSYSGQFTGSGFGDFLIGTPNTADISTPHNIDYLHGNWGVFWGDDWRFSRRLTLNLGLRWEYHTPIAEKFGAQASLGLAGGLPTYFVSRPVTLPPTFPFPVKVQGRYLNEPQHNDWAPRLGFAYQVTPTTVVRGAYGIYWQAEEIGTYSNPSPGFNPPFFIDAVFNAVSTTQVNPLVNKLENGFPPNAITSGFDPTSVFYTQLQPNLADAYVQSWNFAVQHEFGPAMSLELAYAGNKGTHLINGPVGNQATPTPNPNSPFAPRTPIPVLNSETFVILSNAYSSYNGLAATFRRRLSQGLSLNVAYTWSHALDLQSSSNLGSSNNNFFRDFNHQFWEYGNADFDTRHRLAVYYEWDLPFGHGRTLASNATGWVNALVGDWKTLGIWSFNTGNWFTPGLSFDPSNSESQDPRPDQICNPNHGAPHTTTQFFNTSCFALPAAGTFGNTGRNTILGPNFFDNDLSLVKDWSFSESRRIEFRAEFFNAFNHPTFPAISDLTADDQKFGHIFTANSSREIQMALKVYW